MRILSNNVIILSNECKNGVVIISNCLDKPKKTANELVDMLCNKKGVHFDLMSKDEAVYYLYSKNNYLRAASYRKNYDKYTSGEHAGKYINLDFAYLAELSALDMHLRSYILPMCIDIEHAMKVKIISSIEKNPNVDGYSICDEFLKKNSYIKDSIAEKADSIFTGDLIDKYFNLCHVFDNQPENNRMDICIQSCDCPIWVLTEIIGFNSLIKFIRFYNEKYPNSIDINTAVLNPVRSLRNACAHNNCLLNNLHPQNTRPPELISNFVKKYLTSKKMNERRNSSADHYLNLLA